MRPSIWYPFKKIRNESSLENYLATFDLSFVKQLERLGTIRRSTYMVQHLPTCFSVEGKPAVILC